MKKYGRDKRPYVKPVTRIELNESNTKLRWILIVVLLSVAVVAFLIGLTSLLNVEPGWQTVTVSSDQPNCSGDFTLLYDFSNSGSAATGQFRQLTNLYTEATEEAYRIFSAELLEEGLYNTAYLNAHVNETVTLDENLYQALALIVQYSDRHFFMAPAMTEYNRVFRSESDAEAAIYDPTANPETTRWLQELAQFVSDPTQISLELLGENQLRLNVAPEYLSFAEENGIETFLDFGWMTNAFIADYIADILMENGFTKGYLASYDGFTRNLDSRGEGYSFNIFDRKENTVSIPACMNYTNPVSIVALRNYPLSDRDRWHYFAFENGRIVTAFLDPADAMSKSATDNLVSYSQDAGCAVILMQTAPVFIADTFEEGALNTLAGLGIHSVWGEGSVLRYTDPAADLTLLPDSGGADYSLMPVQ